MTDAPDKPKPVERDYSCKRMMEEAKKIPQDEPVFLLRAQDITAAATVLIWARNLQALRQPGPKVQEALLHASAMALWPVKKIPD